MTKRIEVEKAPAPLEEYVEAFDPLLGKSNQREGFRQYLEGLLLPSERHKTLTGLINTEPVVGAQLPRAQKLQWFLSESDWDERAVQQQRLHLLVKDPLTTPNSQGVLIIDEAGDRKAGHRTAHVGKQYLANLGKIDNGVVTVTSLWADERVYYPVDFEPYTPAPHFERGEADPQFRTKHKLAVELVRRAVQAGIPFRAVVADSVYGEDHGVKQELRYLNVGYVLALHPSHGWMQGTGLIVNLGLLARVARLKSPEQTGMWIKLNRTFRDGTREDWWTLEVMTDLYGPNRLERVVIATTDPVTLPSLNTFYLVTNLPAPGSLRAQFSNLPAASLQEVVHLYGLRMWVAQSYKQVKHDLGWSQYQVRSDTAIRRHWQLVCCAFSFCWYNASYTNTRTIQARQQQSDPEAGLPTSISADPAGMGGKNQRGAKNTSTDVLADGPVSSAWMAGSLDHAQSLVERLVITAPTSCYATAASLA